MLFDHQMNTEMMLPVGQSRPSKGKPFTIKGDGKKVQGTVYFDKGNPAAMNIGRMVSEGLLNMASIGFKPFKAIWMPSEEDSSQQNVANMRPGAMGGWDFVETLLYEWSIVTYGADPGAIRQSLERKKIADDKLMPNIMQMMERYAEKPISFGVGLPDHLRQTIEPQEMPIGEQQLEETTVEDRLQAIEQKIEQLLQRPTGVVVDLTEEPVPIVVTKTQKIDRPVDGAEIAQGVVASVVEQLTPFLQSLAEQTVKCRKELNYATKGEY